MNDVLLDTRGPFNDKYRYGTLEIFSFNQATFALSPLPLCHRMPPSNIRD
jgi:hypothetical protein